MNQDIFLEKMVNLLDTELKISMDTTLAEIEEWDSFSLVNFLSMASSWGKIIRLIDVRNAVTIFDLYALVEA